MSCKSELSKDWVTLPKIALKKFFTFNQLLLLEQTIGKMSIFNVHGRLMGAEYQEPSAGRQYSSARRSPLGVKANARLDKSTRI